MNHHKKNNKSIWLYGKHPTMNALLNKRRNIEQIVITKNNQIELNQFLADKQIKINKNLIRIADNNFISSLLAKNSLHQGFALKSSPLETISDKEFLSGLNKFDKNNLPPILILDQLTDPHNIGAIIRSAIAFDVKNIIITKHNFPQESAIISKSSSGTVELVNLIEAVNLNNLLTNLKNIGYWCIGLDGAAKSNIKEVKDYKNLVLIIGSEGCGIRQLVKKNCDLLVKIPIIYEVESLNASNAAAITLYELFGK